MGIVDLLLPIRCGSCGAEGAVACAGCAAGLRRLEGTLCARCGAPTSWPVVRCRECAGRRLGFATARSAIAYEGPGPPLVGAWKERGVRRLTAFFAGLVVEAVPRPEVDALTFVPGERARSLWRGHNPAEALARALGFAWELPVLPLLLRAGPAPRQRGLSREARRTNVRGRFRAAVHPPPRVVLVDDVYTTGATVAAAAAELRLAGAKTVHVVTFARAVRR